MLPPQAERPLPMPLEEAIRTGEPGRPILRLLLILGAILLVLLPFVTTFNEFLTRMVETLGLDAFLAGLIVPWEVRLVAALLRLVGIPSSVTEGMILMEKSRVILPVYISWNCVGWQSFILFAATLITGMQGPFTRASKVETVIIGFLGTFLINLLRIASVAVVAYYFGQLPAVVYHDYGGTIVILVWLALFWWFSHGWLLQPVEGLPAKEPEEQYLKDMYPAQGESPAS
ncbi:MAG: exosortase/archaeosortase family protein [Chloroflexota bacterium]